MSQPLVILGGEGTGVIIAEAVRAAREFSPYVILGFLNDFAPQGARFVGHPVLGPFDRWRECPPNAKFISAFPKAKESAVRLQRLAALGIPDDRCATVIHPAAVIAEGVELGTGSFVGACAVIEPGVIGGRHICVRGGSYISHDVRLGEFAFIGPNATIMGRCSVGEGAHISANAVCWEEITIGRHAVVGIGAVVVANVPDRVVLAGNPARVISHMEPR
jgi:sugar O-acyltransferase (sialic acid O-acetyltransferase NeuD family)